MTPEDLRLWRAKWAMTQEEAAAVFGVTRQTYAKMESHRHRKGKDFPPWVWRCVRDFNLYQNVIYNPSG